MNVSNTPLTSFVFYLVIPDEVKLEISRIPNGKSHGLYSCPTKILKSSANVISSTLAQIIKRALRFIYFSDFKQHAVPLFIEAGVLPLKFSFFKIIANLMYDVGHKIAPSKIQKQFQDISNIHPHYTRSSASNNFYTQSSRLSIQLNSFSRTGSTIWNGIPFTLRNLRKSAFTRKITSLLFDILISEDSYLETCEIIQRIKHFAE